MLVGQPLASPGSAKNTLYRTVIQSHGKTHNIYFLRITNKRPAEIVRKKVWSKHNLNQYNIKPIQMRSSFCMVVATLNVIDLYCIRVN